MELHEQLRLWFNSALYSGLLYAFLTLNVIIQESQGLGRYVVKNETAAARLQTRQRPPPLNPSGSASLHRVPLVPKQLQNRFYDGAAASPEDTSFFNVQNETLLALGVLSVAFICLVSAQVWRQVSWNWFLTFLDSKWHS